MKHILFLCSLWALSCNSSQKASTKNAQSATGSNQDAAITYAQTITEDELKEHLYIYASDEFEGRETGEPGQKKAVAYLKDQYQKIGVPAAKGGTDYFQKVPLEIALLPQGSINVQGKEYPLGEHILAFHSFRGDFDDIVYVGYGIEEGDHSDYEGIEVTGKVILAKFGEPMNPDGTSAITGTAETSKWSNMSEALDKRRKVAQAKGAKALLFYDEVNFPRYRSYFNTMKRNASGRMELADAGERLWSSLIDAELAQKLFPDITKDATPKTLNIPIKFALDNANGKVDSENVVAVLKGSEKPNEYVVISSHLDHIGVEPNGDINNGADDDGSGTVALLEIAEAFKKASEAGHGPKRSIVFLHVTGEEKGLLGSQYYADHDPIFPLENTVA
ncbi:MAG: M28 family peptidase, partial [Flavobacteriaceae bacterium]